CPPSRRRSVVGVASGRTMLILGSSAPAMEVLGFLATYRAAGKQVRARGSEHVTLVLSRENLHEESRLRAALAERFGAVVRLVDDLGALSVVGTGINASFDNLRRGTDALAAAGMTPYDTAT